MNTKFITRIAWAWIIISFTIFNCSSLFAQGWFAVHSDTTSDWESIFFTDVNTGYATGWKGIGGVYFPRIVKTTNAGSSWVEKIGPERDSAGFAYRSVFFTDINTGFIAVANINNVNIGRILKTTNGGDNWSIAPLPVDKHLTYVYFINSSTGYASGHQTILKTTNAGTTWVQQSTTGVGGYLFAIHFTAVDTGYVTGNSGTILKTTNGGTNWNFLPSGTGIHLWGVSFADANTGVAVGGLTNNTQNIILRTTNAGSTWTQITSYSTCLLYSVRFVNQTTGWITGSCSQILKTTNGGLNWCRQTSPVSNEFRRSFFLNALTGYVGGNVFPVTGQPCYILKTTDGGGVCIPVGIEPISNEVPSQFQLYQNFPNPFNPSTSIKFGIPKESFTKLVLFDVLGREVATLVNEQLKPGTYEVQWDAPNYPSGVYYYKLITEGYTETKKMVLIK